ncbi:type I-D CRISPR-associated helicase Cas3' [Thermoleptolyngbya sp. M55_K2018_002]|uniref:type I-D CRISPR-associated helicase Cas3' n=1 Tax=Thermoleptolyngbya sp. M55_K2018_002 TaxID=2747808 RepID=UPI001A036099|nr:type I-D CRISPR-associated helicase Cas3' [Thermoleptolyngbya sp. M55_K2018_002]HIK39590.1 type I-D CRISPR-associated helicase Cas3' [Thermoleptolyngbya sp. M55_K2018_002]
MDSLRIQLEPRSIATCPNPSLPTELLKAFGHGILQHQTEVYEAAKTHDIILDLAPTGTGKTKAGLSVIHHNRNRNAIYIAPTNALIEQQTEAAQTFVDVTGLPHVVVAASAKQVREWPDDRVGPRPGEKIYNLLREPATIFPEYGGRPLLLVTNPDIFYYAAFFQYGSKDRSNIASEFYSSFSTIIFDEFHLYDAKQLVSLLFYLVLSQVFSYFEHGRKIVLLTATPEPACEAALDLLQKEGVKIQKVDGQSSKSHQIPSQTSVNLEIRQQIDKESLIVEITDEVVNRLQKQPDQHGAIILDSKDTLNRIADRLRQKIGEHHFGRIIGNTPKEQRHSAAQKQVILATSTVDVGFNFEREIEPDRQNLDWLIFSSRDRFSFWQRIGRVGRVLGKPVTHIPSEAIAYLPEKAWEQGIADLPVDAGRTGLQQKLEALDCLKRPFLDIYWRSEAFLEIARPLLELETQLEGLPQASLVTDLYRVLQTVLQGKRDWDFYKKRMRLLQGAENLAKVPPEKIQKDWKYIKGGQSCLMSFLRTCCPEDYEDILTGRASIASVESLLKENLDLAEDLRNYAKILHVSYSPLFRFRDSFFESLKIQDPHKLLLDEAGEAIIDPIHLLRFYEFESDEEKIIALSRAEQPYSLAFSLYVDSLEEFENNCLCRLFAFENCSIKRMIGDSTRPTALIKEIEKQLIPGVVVKEHNKNRWAIVKLRKQGLECYPIHVSGCDSPTPKEYLFFPSLSGILAIATAGVNLQSPDNEEFWVA